MKTSNSMFNLSLSAMNEEQLQEFFEAKAKRVEEAHERRAATRKALEAADKEEFMQLLKLDESTVKDMNQVLGDWLAINEGRHIDDEQERKQYIEKAAVSQYLIGTIEQVPDDLMPALEKEETPFED